MKLEETWRWFGPDDTTTLQDIRQVGATGIVTALHHLPIGEAWSLVEIQERKETILKAGLDWPVVESVPVHDDIKRRNGNYETWIENYKETIRNLGKCEIEVLCYNFMPVLDWTRTDLHYQLPDGTTSLRFDEIALAAFDLFILKRHNAENEYNPEIIKSAKVYEETHFNSKKSDLTKTILAGLPGSEESYTIGQFKQIVSTYNGITPEILRNNLRLFLTEIVPVAENSGVRLAIHPDDPPFSLFGLPRVVSTEDDLQFIINSVKSTSNGWTLCTGSLGVNTSNNLTGMIRRIGDRLHFAHLRNIKLEYGRTFHEADHLYGNIDMAEVMKELLNELNRRTKDSKSEARLPIRPDHGHNMLTDIKSNKYPGYSLFGRMRGLAELRGLELGLKHNMFRR